MSNIRPLYLEIRSIKADYRNILLGVLILDKADHLTALADDVELNSALEELAIEINDLFTLQLPDMRSNPTQPFMSFYTVIRRGDPRFPEAIIYYLLRNCGIAANIKNISEVNFY